MNGPEPPSVDLPERCDELGHVFHWIHTGTAAFDAIVAMIDAAIRFVDFEFYTVATGAASERIGAALARAARLGLRVRVLIDSFGSSSLPVAWVSALRREGADVRWFNPRPLLRLSFRNHRKLVVCDERSAFLGGFNVAREYEGDGIVRGWRDFGVRIDGPVAADLAVGFQEMFLAAGLIRAELPRLARFLRMQPIVDDAPTALTGGPGSPRALMRQTLHADLKNARRVDAIAAYFAPSRRIRRLLKRVARSGQVRILLGGKSDVPVSRWASQWLYPGMLRDGVSLWEYVPQILHAKVLVVDDVVYIGSANLDTRSLQLNFELLVRLPSAALAAQVRQRIDFDCRHSKLVPADWAERRTLWQRLIHSWSYFLLTKLDPFLARREFKHLS